MRFELCFSACALCSCTASVDAVQPRADQLNFPTGTAVAPDESVLFVANANSDLRYNAGSVAVFDLARIDAAIAAWTGPDAVVPAGCERDAFQRETLACDEAQFMVAGASVQIGNFATNIAVQDRGDGRARLLIPTRGDPSVIWADWDGTRLTCAAGGEAFASCDQTHRLTGVHGDEALARLPEEPFDAFVDSAREFAIVTHLTGGAVTLIDSPRDGEATIADMVTGAFTPNASGRVGASGVAGRISATGEDIVYVGSPYEGRIQTFTVGRPVNAAPPYLLFGSSFLLDGVGAATGSVSDTRALAFGQGGDRLYNLNRNPPSLQIHDTSLSSSGVPRNTLLASTDICRVAERHAVIDSGDGERIYLTCFDDGETYVVDPRGASRVEDILSVGRGPYGVAAAQRRGRIYVTNVLEDTLVVIDAAASSPTRNRVLLRLGVPRAP